MLDAFVEPARELVADSKVVQHVCDFQRPRAEYGPGVREGILQLRVGLDVLAADAEHRTEGIQCPSPGFPRCRACLRQP